MDKSKSKSINFFLGLALIVPLLWIWAINTLFQLEIPYSFKTYLAMLVGYVSVTGKIPFSFKIEREP